MNAWLTDVMYHTYQVTEADHLKDLTIGLAKYRVDLVARGRDISQEEDREVREFMGKHSKDLAKAYASGKDVFINTVTELAKKDEEENG